MENKVVLKFLNPSFLTQTAPQPVFLIKFFPRPTIGQFLFIPGTQSNKNLFHDTFKNVHDPSVEDTGLEYSEFADRTQNLHLGLLLF